jgi:phosphatidylserine/phosphatidylglycerophosphate/cardiolipin synthase-like enzyme
MKLFRDTVLVFLLAVGSPISAIGDGLQACSSPWKECTAMIVDAINGAKHTIFVQAYGFSSTPIRPARFAMDTGSGPKRSVFW